MTNDTPQPDPPETCCICKLPVDLAKPVVIYAHGTMAHPDCHHTARIVRDAARKALKAAKAAKPQ